MTIYFKTFLLGILTIINVAAASMKEVSFNNDPAMKLKVSFGETGKSLAIIVANLSYDVYRVRIDVCKNRNGNYAYYTPAVCSHYVGFNYFDPDNFFAKGGTISKTTCFPFGAGRYSIAVFVGKLENEGWISRLDLDVAESDLQTCDPGESDQYKDLETLKSFSKEQVERKKFSANHSYLNTEAPELIELAKKITQGLTTDREKSKAIYSWIIRNISYDTGIFKIQGSDSAGYIISTTIPPAKKAIDVFRDRLGVALAIPF